MARSINKQFIIKYLIKQYLSTWMSIWAAFRLSVRLFGSQRADLLIARLAELLRKVQVRFGSFASKAAGAGRRRMSGPPRKR